MPVLVEPSLRHPPNSSVAFPNDLEIVPFKRTFPFDILSAFVAYLDPKTLRTVSTLDREWNDETNRIIWSSIHIRQFDSDTHRISIAALHVIRNPHRARWIRNASIHLRDLPIPYQGPDCTAELDMLWHTLQIIPGLKNLQLWVNAPEGHIPFVARSLVSQTFLFRLRSMYTNIPLSSFQYTSSAISGPSLVYGGDPRGFLQGQTCLEVYDEHLCESTRLLGLPWNSEGSSTVDKLDIGSIHGLPRLSSICCPSAALSKMVCGRPLESIGTTIRSAQDICALLRAMSLSTSHITSLRLTIEPEPHPQRFSPSLRVPSNDSYQALVLSDEELLVQLFSALVNPTSCSRGDGKGAVVPSRHLSRLTIRLCPTLHLPNEPSDSLVGCLRRLVNLQSIWWWGRMVPEFVGRPGTYAGLSLRRVEVGGFESPVGVFEKRGIVAAAGDDGWTKLVHS